MNLLKCLIKHGADSDAKNEEEQTPIHLQGGHGTGKTGKTGNLTLTFSRQGKHREFCCDTGKIFETQGKYFDCILLCECYIFMYFWQSWFQKMGVCR